MICHCVSDDVEINSFEVVTEPESIPPDDDEEADELLLSRMMSASKISSKVKETLPQITFILSKSDFLWGGKIFTITDHSIVSRPPPLVSPARRRQRCCRCTRSRAGRAATWPSSPPRGPSSRPCATSSSRVWTERGIWNPGFLQWGESSANFIYPPEEMMLHKAKNDLFNQCKIMLFTTTNNKYSADNSHLSKMSCCQMSRSQIVTHEFSARGREIS